MNYRSIAARVCAGLLAISALVGGVRVLPARAQQETGPTIAVGATALVGAEVRVPVNATGSGFSPYTGFSLHLRWDPAVFAFARANATGGLFDADAGKSICVSASGENSSYDRDGGGVIFSCAALGAAETGNTGLLMTAFLTPKGNGCSPLHLITLGGADNGDTTSGTYSISKDGNPQTNQYADGSSDVAGNVCGPAAAATVAPATGNIPATEAAAALATTIAQGTPPPPGYQPLPDNATPASDGATATSAANTTPSDTTPSDGSASSGATPGSTSAASAATASAAKRAATSTPSAGTNGTKTSGGSGTSSGLIVGLVIAAIAVVGGAAGGFLYYRRRAA